MSIGSMARRSVRVKLAVLLVVASLLPLGLLAWLDFTSARRQFMAATEALLAARADELVRRVDGFNENFRAASQRLAALPEVLAAASGQGEPARAAARAALTVWRGSDPTVRGAGILSSGGVVTMASEPALVGQNLSRRPWVREATQGHPVISDVFVDESAGAGAPTIAYLTPVRGPGGAVSGVVVLWIRAEALWQLMKTANAQVGPGSYGALVDGHGIRIAHTFSERVLFHPAAALDAQTRQALLAERRFGARTAALLDEVWAFPEAFEQVKSTTPRSDVFRGFGPVNAQWDYVVARRAATAPWTVFYLLPQPVVDAQMAQLAREKWLFASGILLAALLVGSLLGRPLVAPIRALARATEAVAAGDLTARVPAMPGGDELARLGHDFNAMVNQLEAHTATVTRSRQELTEKVTERTAELLRVTKALEAEVDERRRAHVELQAREGELRSALDNVARHQARLSALFESGLIGVVVGTFDGRVLEINDALLDMLGYTRDEIVSGRISWTALTPPEWRSRDQEAVQVLQSRGALPIREKQYLHKDGHRVPVIVGTAVLGDPPEAISFVLDVTQNREAATAIAHLSQARASEERFRALLEAAPDGVVITGGHGQIVYVNGQTERLFGYGRAELVGQPIEILVPERLRAAHPAHRREYGREPRVRAMGAKQELYGRRRDGSEVPIEVSLSPLQAEESLVISTVRDITERRQADELRFRLAAMVESSGDAIIGMTLEGLITSWNEAATRIFGYSRDEIVGQSVLTLIPPERQQEEVDILDRLARGERIEQFDTVRLRKDGHPMDVSLTSSPVRDGRGRLIGASKIVRDTTERRRAQTALAQARDQAEAASRELEAFSYSVAHDLRAPLRAMNGFAHLLLQSHGDKLDADSQDWLQEIVLNAKKMAELIDALLSLARVTRSEVRTESVDLSALARDVVADLRKEDPGRQVEIHVEEGLRADADPRLLRALLDNLLGNAWKFTGRVARAHIEFRALPGQAAPTFFVRDDGAGFDMKYGDKLFAPFQRLHSGAEFGGTGIGLATAQRIVRRHGGRIWAEGAMGQGATFYFTLPSRGASLT